MKSNEDIIKALHSYVEENGFSKSEAARSFNVSVTAFIKWLNGGNIRENQWKTEVYPKLKTHLEPNPPESRIPDKLSDAYESLKIVSRDKTLFWIAEQFLRNSASVVKDKETQIHLSSKNLRVLEIAEQDAPPYHLEAAAGIGNIEQFIPPISFEQAQKMKYERVKVDGESMQPTLKDGGFYFMKKLEIGHIHIPAVEKPEIELKTLRTYIKEGSIVMVDLNQSGRTLKRIHYRESSSGTFTIFLVADNEEWGKENGFPRAITRKDELFIYGEITAQEEVEPTKFHIPGFYVAGYFLMELSSKRGIMNSYLWVFLFLLGFAVCILSGIDLGRTQLDYKSRQLMLDIFRKRENWIVKHSKIGEYSAKHNDLQFDFRLNLAAKEKFIIENHYHLK